MLMDVVDERSLLEMVMFSIGSELVEEKNIMAPFVPCALLICTYPSWLYDLPVNQPTVIRSSARVV